MTQNELRMMEALEKAREMSEYTDGTIYAFGNGKEIKIVTKFSLYDGWPDKIYNKTRERLTNEGYWVVSIFENGHRVSA